MQKSAAAIAFDKTAYMWPAYALCTSANISLKTYYERDNLVILEDL